MLSYSKKDEMYFFNGICSLFRLSFEFYGNENRKWMLKKI